MQSGKGKTKRWLIDWDVLPGAGRWENDLMGWASSADYMQGTVLAFGTREDAVAFVRGRALYSWCIFGGEGAAALREASPCLARNSRPGSPRCVPSPCPLIWLSADTLFRPRSKGGITWFRSRKSPRSHPKTMVSRILCCTDACNRADRRSEQLRLHPRQAPDPPYQVANICLYAFQVRVKDRRFRMYRSF